MYGVALTTLGCKANWVDGEEICRSLSAAGLRRVPFESKADAYIINTCTVTAVADQQSRQMIRRTRRANPKAIVVACGCMCEVSKNIPEVDAVFGTHDREELIKYLCEKFGMDASAQKTGGPQSRARAFLKIQDGCDKRCAYCIVPKARGKSRSVPAEEISQRALELAKYHREIVLTGIDIGQYEGGLAGLLGHLANIKGLPRIRISSIDPTVVDKRLIELISSGKICRHIHLSMQSGSDLVLKRMGRRYDAREISRAVTLLSENIPHIAVTGDVIAGFPGETKVEHAETMKLLGSLPFASLHVFPYSERAGTAAAAMPNQIPPTVRKARAADIRGLAVKRRQEFLRGLVGQNLDVIVTSKTPDDRGVVRAFSDNAVSVALPAKIVEYAALGRAKITAVDELMVRGIWESQKKTKTC